MLLRASPSGNLARMPKRKSTQNDDATSQTPKKRRINEPVASPLQNAVTPGAETPSKQRSILKRDQLLVNGEATPKSLRKVLFSEPATPQEEQTLPPLDDSPLTAARNGDRSARRKSARRLFEVSAEDGEDDDALGEEDALTQEILDEDENEDQLEEDVIAVDPASPSKSVLRGRPKGRRRQRSPTPPQDLPPHELYFFQNRPGASKTSTNTLAAKDFLSHDDYFAQIKAYQDPHDPDREHLARLHMRSFDQWIFELEEGFNLCLYGYGSKRGLIMSFAEHLCASHAKSPTIVVVNGYAAMLSIKDILTLLANALLPKSAKLPLQPPALLDTVLNHLTNTDPRRNVHLLIHSIDAQPLRKPAVQSMLSRLASHPNVSLVASADTPNFGLLWDTSQRSQYHFLFHDTTTFEPYTAEIDVVDEVNSLLGRSGRRVGGKDGISYVLQSLPENARSLFRILVAEQLALLDSAGEGVQTSVSNGFGSDEDDDGLLGFESPDEDDMDINDPSTPSRVRRGRPAKAPKPKPKKAKVVQATVEGVEYRTLYHKAVEEFVCSSEVGFRTLLKEFHDHQMIESRKDGVGTERLAVPFSRAELEGLLEELV